MSTEDQEPVCQKTQDSLTTRHIEQSSELLKKLTTAHIQQKLGAANPIRNQGKAAETGSGSGGGQQQSSADKK